MGREETSRDLSGNRPAGVEVKGPDLYTVGFALDSIELCTRLSGLVVVHEVEAKVVDGRPVLFFFVSSLDKTGTLFRNGSLIGNRIPYFYKGLQSRYVSVYQVSVGDAS